MRFHHLESIHSAMNVPLNIAVCSCRHMRFYHIPSIHSAMNIPVNNAFCVCSWDHHFFLAFAFIKTVGLWRHCSRWSEATCAGTVECGWFLNWQCSRTGVECWVGSAFLHEIRSITSNGISLCTMGFWASHFLCSCLLLRWRFIVQTLSYITYELDIVWPWQWDVLMSFVTSHRHSGLGSPGIITGPGTFPSKQYW